MKISMTRICLLAAAPLLIAGAAKAANISGPIGSTLTITTNSKLTGNVTCTVSGAPCIKFGASNIELDLKGFTITGNGSQGSCTLNFPEDGIDTNGKNNVSIEGPGIVRRFNGHGIVVGGNNSKVEKVTVLSSCIEGIHVQGSRNQIEENSVDRSSLSSPTGFFAGIFLANPGGSNYIRNNEVIGAAQGYGIFVGEPGAPSNNNVIVGNNASGNGLGIWISNGSTGNQFRRNQALGNNSGVDIIDFNVPGVTHFDDNLCEASRGGSPTVIATDVCKEIPDLSGHRNPN